MKSSSFKTDGSFKETPTIPPTCVVRQLITLVRHGISGLFADTADVSSNGKCERIGVKSFCEVQEFSYQLAKEYSTLANVK
ncbi:MAG: hypothetical protein ABIS36_26315 [Chryseolinea sp.]